MEKLAQVPIGEKFFGKANGFLTQTTDIGKLVSIIVSNALVVASIILLFLLVFGGIAIIAGAGSDNPEQAAKGKQAATAAVIGFIIVFAAYWIIQIIQVITGFEIVSPIF